MSEREQEVYNLLIKARDIAYNAADFDVSSQVTFTLLYMDHRESERTG